jgi:hypothetical protein
MLGMLAMGAGSFKPSSCFCLFRYKVPSSFNVGRFRQVPKFLQRPMRCPVGLEFYSQK